jgi:hypothetical protein
MVRAIRMVLGWRLRGQGWPNPFYERDTRAPIYPVGVLSRGPPSILRVASNGASGRAHRPLTGPTAATLLSLALASSPQRV